MSYRYKFDDLDLASRGFLCTQVEGTVTVPARRHTPQAMSWKHGGVSGDTYFGPAIDLVEITVFPTDDDGDVAHSEGQWGRVNQNRERLNTILGKRGLIDVRKYVPALIEEWEDSGEEEESGASGPVELQGYARVFREVPYIGETQLFTVQVELVYPYPFWHELPKQTLEPATDHDLWTGGSAPVADMVFAFTSDGTVTYEDQTIGIQGLTSGTALIDVGKRTVTVGGNLRMDLFRLDGPEYWMEWPAQTEVTLTATSAVGVEFYSARHH